MVKRKRNKPIFFRVDENEFELIRKKMDLLHINDMGAYLRRMAIYGYMIEVDMEPLNRLTVELSRIGNNLNQLTKRAKETGNIYIEDIEKIAFDVTNIKGYLKDFTLNLADDNL